MNGAPSRFGSFSSTYDEMYKTDDRGVYRLYGLAGGHYKASVGEDSRDGIIHGRYQPTFHPDVTTQSKAAIVELKDGGEVTISISMSGALGRFGVRRVRD